MCETRSSVMCVRESEEAQGISSDLWRGPVAVALSDRERVTSVRGSRYKTRERDQCERKTAEIPVSSSMIYAAR